MIYPQHTSKRLFNKQWKDESVVRLIETERESRFLRALSTYVFTSAFYAPAQNRCALTSSHRSSPGTTFTEKWSPLLAPLHTSCCCGGRLQIYGKPEVLHWYSLLPPLVPNPFTGNRNLVFQAVWIKSLLEFVEQCEEVHWKLEQPHWAANLPASCWQKYGRIHFL